MNWLIVGTGDIARKRIFPAIDAEPRSNIYAVCDIAKERAESAAADFGAHAYTDYKEALADENIDAVYVSTPVFLHVPQAIEALNAGKHVIVEKPVGVSYLDAGKLTAAAEKSDCKCAVAYFRRFSDRYKMAKEMLDKGEFGQVVLLRMTYFSWFNPAGEDPKFWRVVPEKSGGGPLSDMGSHMFDVMIGLFGLPQSVFARVATNTHSYSAEDSSVMVMTYDDGPQVTASFHWNSKTWSHEFEIIGTEAKVKWHPYDGPTILKTVGRQIDEIEMPNHHNVHYPLIEDFVSAITEDRQPLVSVSEAAKTNQLLDAVYQSGLNCSEVTLEST